MLSDYHKHLMAGWDQAFDEGYAAALDESRTELTENPYDHRVELRLYEEWDQGYRTFGWEREYWPTGPQRDRSG